jgi:hypothetical protein
MLAMLAILEATKGHLLVSGSREVAALADTVELVEAAAAKLLRAQDRVALAAAEGEVAKAASLFRSNTHGLVFLAVGAVEA